jgi:Ca2+/Na+ antiporter
MRKFFKGRKLSILGCIVVGVVAIFAPYINPEIEHNQSILMFILFVLFVVVLEIIYKRKK